MPSPPLAADQVPVDLDHLSRMTCGEKALEREVLELFQQQTDQIIAALADEGGETAALSHTLKGSARAIGAFGVADRAAALEAAACQGHDPAQPLAELRAAVAEARGAIEALLRRP